MNDERDPLWDPTCAGDPALRRMETLLASFSAAARGLAEQVPDVAVAGRDRPAVPGPSARKPLRTATRSHSRRRWLRGLLGVAAAGAAAGLLVAAGLAYRLAWTDGQPWQVVATQPDGERASRFLVPGEAVLTRPGEAVDIRVARIGRVALSPDSSLRLIETRSGRHRVELDSGHLRARIWAPPDYFAVSSGVAEVVDLGCDFDLWKRPDGSGRVHVRSGWISYRVGTRDLLVPAGFELRFDGAHAHTPVRPAADAGFVAAVIELERILGRSGPPSSDALDASRAVADAAADADGFTLLSLLTQHPTLADSAVYSRLARVLGRRSDGEAHRSAWRSGDTTAIDAWWNRLSVQPKTWWANWADALP